MSISKKSKWLLILISLVLALQIVFSLISTYQWVSIGNDPTANETFMWPQQIGLGYRSIRVEYETEDLASLAVGEDGTKAFEPGMDPVSISGRRNNMLINNILNLLIWGYVLIQTRLALKGLLSSRTPFESGLTQRIKKIGTVLLVVSIARDTVTGLLVTLFTVDYQVVAFSVNLALMSVAIGLYVLGDIFEHGQYLQTEVDEMI